MREVLLARRTQSVSCCLETELEVENNQMACIAVGIIRGMKDEAVFAEYRAVAGEALAKHGGSIVVPPSPPTVLDGEDTPAAVVVLEFPDTASAEAWRNDPELASIHEMRNNGVHMDILAVGS
ncbi:MAG: DUF1330 domain-containing protein [Actinobacteria bacterium]|nr:DUF1330 domain-containing protein [Actinomycetota bacterium]